MTEFEDINQFLRVGCVVGFAIVENCKSLEVNLAAGMQNCQMRGFQVIWYRDLPASMWWRSRKQIDEDLFSYFRGQLSEVSSKEWLPLASDLLCCGGRFFALVDLYRYACRLCGPHPGTMGLSSRVRTSRCHDFGCDRGESQMVGEKKSNG